MIKMVDTHTQKDIFTSFYDIKTTIPVFLFQLLVLYTNHPSLKYKSRSLSLYNLMFFNLYNNSPVFYFINFSTLYFISNYISTALFIKQVVFTILFNRLILLYAHCDMSGLSFDVSGILALLFSSGHIANFSVVGVTFYLIASKFGKPLYTLSFASGYIIYNMSVYNNLIVFVGLFHIYRHSNIITHLFSKIFNYIGNKKDIDTVMNVINVELNKRQKKGFEKDIPNAKVLDVELNKRQQKGFEKDIPNDKVLDVELNKRQKKGFEKDIDTVMNTINVELNKRQQKEFEKIIPNAKVLTPYSESSDELEEELEQNST